MFKVNQKVRVVVPREGKLPAIFEGYLVNEVNEMSKNLTIKKDNKVFNHIFFWLDGKSKKRQDSTIECQVVPLDVEVNGKKEPLKIEGEVLKDLVAELDRQYAVYILRRQEESKKRKTDREVKEKEKKELKAKFSGESSS